MPPFCFIPVVSHPCQCMQVFIPVGAICFICNGAAKSSQSKNESNPSTSYSKGSGASQKPAYPSRQSGKSGYTSKTCADLKRPKYDASKKHYESSREKTPVAKQPMSWRNAQMNRGGVTVIQQIQFSGSRSQAVQQVSQNAFISAGSYIPGQPHAGYAKKSSSELSQPSKESYSKEQKELYHGLVGKNGSGNRP